MYKGDVDVVESCKKKQTVDFDCHLSTATQKQSLKNKKRGTKVRGLFVWVGKPST
jgi:hypothetical protein